MGNKTVLWDQEGSVLMKVLLDEDVYSAVMEEVYSVRSFAVSHPFVSRSGIQAPLPLQTSSPACGSAVVGTQGLSSTWLGLSEPAATSAPIAA